MQWPENLELVSLGLRSGSRATRGHNTVRGLRNKQAIKDDTILDSVLATWYSESPLLLNVVGQ